MGATDPFAVLDRIVRRYRRDVHLLGEPASPDALASLESHLGRRLPPGLRQFVARHNGAELFRGALRIRSTSEIAQADENLRNVLSFADSVDGYSWGFGRLHDGRHVFGRVDGDRLEVLHSSFEYWLDATLEILDARVTRPEDQATIRRQVAPDDAAQLFAAGFHALHAGQPDVARPLLERVTRLDPTHVAAWQRLGDALAASDRLASRKAWLTALHQARLPLAFVGAPALDPEIFVSLGRTFRDPEEWERELERFLEERVHEVRHDEEFDILVAAASAMSDSLARRGKRAQARQVLADLLSRSTLFELRRTPWGAALTLARLEIDLGHHDEAEKHLRQVRLQGPPEVQADAHILLARITILREEPWAEDVLADAELAATHDDQRIRIALLRCERAVRHDRTEDARAALDRARRLIANGAPHRLRAAAAFAEGDVARSRGDLDRAERAWRKTVEILADRPAPELRLRVQMRRGDAIRELDSAAARELYAEAARGFAEHELPLREAWTLVRLARLTADPDAYLRAARARFLEADLAAGIAVVDALSRNPSASLGWHLDRAAEHARARYNAQRSRPPWHRSDADRPERRLGAHRIAIAACGDAVVQALAVEMDAAARAIRAGRGRPLDPPVLRYVASVDLLAGHRSYTAAQVLLRHLIDGVVDGVARRALMGAMARSPNAALADGLLRCIEGPSHIPATAVALAAEVLGMRKEGEAVRPLVRLAEDAAHPLSRKAAIAALGRIGQRGAVDIIAAALEDPALAEQAALSLLMLGDRRGIDFHAQALSENRRDLSGHPGEIVGRYGGPSHLLVLISAATNSEDDTALGALQGLGLMGDPRAMPTLLDALDPRNPRRAEIAAGALQILTGHTIDADSPGMQRRWQAWWQEHAGRFPNGVRHRSGQLLDAGFLIGQMEAPDPWTRRTAYDELVITTGAPLPFDSDGPWRTQQAHLHAWRRWWLENRARQPAGRWYLDGRSVG